MKFNVLRSAAATLSMMGVCSVASAQYGVPGFPTTPNYQTASAGTAQQAYPVPGYPATGYHAPGFSPYGPQAQLGTPQTAMAPPSQAIAPYQAPAKWNNFGNPSATGPALFQPASSGLDDALASPEMVPTPSPMMGNGGTAAVGHSAPVSQPYSAPMDTSGMTPSASTYTPVPSHVTHLPSADGSCQSCNQGVSPYATAASQPWEGVSYGGGAACGVPVAAPARPALFPWFGSFEVLFLDLETNNKNRNLVSVYDATDPTRPYLPSIGSSLIDPDSGVGYRLSFGRYLGCGQFGLGATYFHFDPSEEVFNSGPLAAMPATVNGADGQYRPVGMPEYQNATMIYMFDNGTQPGDSGDDYQEITGAASPYSVYAIIDGSAGQLAADGGDLDADSNGNTAGTDSIAEATMVQARRNVGFQGIELNLFSFGLMGAQRAAAINCGGGGLARCLGAGFGGIGGYGSCNTNQCGNTCGPRFGFGGLGGPLVRPCHGKVQILTSHGFRWFQFDDTEILNFDVDGRAGFTGHDICDCTEIENNLFGYQFGSRLNYCLGNRINLNVGGNFGIYGNDIEQTHRLGTSFNLAELQAMPGVDIDFRSSDTVLATLGEIDFGVGYRVSNGITARFGYRLLGATGIATTAGFARDYSSSANASAIHADDSLLLHGLYVGSDLNW